MILKCIRKINAEEISMKNLKKNQQIVVIFHARFPSIFYSVLLDTNKQIYQ